MKPPRVEVRWLDACLRSPGAVPLSEVERHASLSERCTLGWLVHQTKKLTVLAITFDAAEKPDEEDHADDLFSIPTGWIVKTTVLEPNKKRRK